MITSIATRAEDLCVTNELLSDVEDHAQSLAGWEQRYQQLSRGRFSGSVLSCSLKGTQFFVEGSNQKTHQEGSPPQGTVALGLPLSCEGSGRAFGQPLERDSLIAVAPRRSGDVRTPMNLRLAGMATEVGELMRHADIWGCEAAVAAAFVQGVVKLPPPISAHLRGSLQSIERLVAGAEGPLKDDNAIVALRKTLLANFVIAIGAASPIPRTPPRGISSHRRIIDQAVNYMRTHIGLPVGMVDICTAVGVQARVLQYCFNEAFDVTPMVFFRGLRLHGVRREIRASSEEIIGDIAARWGIWHLSRFAAEYRTLFGELPSDTRRNRRISLIASQKILPELADHY